MNESVFAPALLCATIGLMLSFAESRVAIRSGVAATLAAAFIATLLPFGDAYRGIATTGCWVGVAVAAACMHLPRPLGRGAAIGLGVAGGASAGLASGEPLASLWAASVLTALPGAWFVAKGRGLFVKVVGSWLAAAALLSLGLGMVETLGNTPDHRE